MVTPLNAGPRPDSEPCLLSSYPFRMTMRPRHVDLDAGFHLSWRALAECHEESRTRFLVQTFGEDFLKGKRDFRMLPVRVTYDYLRPASYPEPLEAGVGVAHLGNTSFEIAMALFQAGQCISLSCAITVHVARNGGALALTEEQKVALNRGKILASAPRSLLPQGNRI